jgi:hypothetical protein
MVRGGGGGVKESGRLAGFSSVRGWQRYRQMVGPECCSSENPIKVCRTELKVMRGVDGSVYIRGFFQKYLEEGGVICIFFLSFFLLAVEREIETKAQTFRYRSLLSEQNQNVLIWSANYRNKSRTFQSVPKLFKIELECFGVFLSSKTKPEQNRANFLSDRNVSIHLCFKGNKAELL